MKLAPFSQRPLIFGENEEGGNGRKLFPWRTAGARAFQTFRMKEVYEYCVELIPYPYGRSEHCPTPEAAKLPKIGPDL
jgi:hypothetical protein